MGSGARGGTPLPPAPSPASGRGGAVRLGDGFGSRPPLSASAEHGPARGGQIGPAVGPAPRRHTMSLCGLGGSVAVEAPIVDASAAMSRGFPRWSGGFIRSGRRGIRAEPFAAINPPPGFFGGGWASNASPGGGRRELRLTRTHSRALALSHFRTFALSHFRTLALSHFRTTGREADASRPVLHPPEPVRRARRGA